MKKVACVFCNSGKSFWQSTKESAEIGNEEERNTRRFVRSMMSLYEVAKTRVRMDPEMSKEFEGKIGMHQRSVY